MIKKWEILICSVLFNITSIFKFIIYFKWLLLFLGIIAVINLPNQLELELDLVNPLFYNLYDTMSKKTSKISYYGKGYAIKNYKRFLHSSNKNLFHNTSKRNDPSWWDIAVNLASDISKGVITGITTTIVSCSSCFTDN